MMGACRGYFVKQKIDLDVFIFKLVIDGKYHGSTKVWAHVLMPNVA